MSDDLYSQVQRRIWADKRFRSLSKPEPNARDLFLYLLTTPRATPIPGLIVMGEPALAEELEWPLKGVQRCIAELETAKMIRIDRSARLIWLPNALRHNAPRSPKNVTGWAKHWRMLPECDLLTEATAAFEASISTRNVSFQVAFARVLGKAPSAGPDDVGMDEPDAAAEIEPKTRSKMRSKTASKMPSPMASQDQDQEQEQDQDTNTHRAGARAREPKVRPLSAIAIPEGAPTSDIVTADVLLGAVARHAMLVTFHGDEQWALRAVGGPQAAGCRAEDAVAAIDAFVTDKAATAPEDGPTLDDFVRQGIGAYLKRAKEYGDAARARQRQRDRPSEPAGVSHSARVVLDVFAEAWEKRQGTPFMKASGDDRKAAELVETARAAAERIGVRPREVVRHVAEGYMRDADPVLADKEYPFAFFAARFGQYGLPKAPKKPAAVPFASAPPDEPCVPPPADMAARLAAIGASGAGAGVPVRRPAA